MYINSKISSVLWLCDWGNSKYSESFSLVVIVIISVLTTFLPNYLPFSRFVTQQRSKRLSKSHYDTIFLTLDIFWFRSAKLI